MSNLKGIPHFGSARLSDRVTAELERRILLGEPEAGQRLPTEAQLCELFGVSRSVVRDALRTLVARGLVRVGPGQGIVVTDPSDEAFGEALLLLLARSNLTMREVTEARAAIEVNLGPLAATRGTADDWEQLDARLAGFADAVECEDWRRAHQEHLAFHLALLRAIHLPALEILLKPMHEIVVLSSVPPANNPELWDVPAHPPILRALREGDEDGARLALRDHFDRFLRDPRYEAFEESQFRDAAVGVLERLADDADGAGARG
jgi:GntR family transcriptional regulator, transcriptional repressor for pyruvate dehydrogenase complex